MTNTTEALNLPISTTDGLITFNKVIFSGIIGETLYHFIQTPTGHYGITPPPPTNDVFREILAQTYLKPRIGEIDHRPGDDIRNIVLEGDRNAIYFTSILYRIPWVIKTETE